MPQTNLGTRLVRDEGDASRVHSLGQDSSRDDKPGEEGSDTTVSESDLQVTIR